MAGKGGGPVPGTSTACRAGQAASWAAQLPPAVAPLPRHWPPSVTKPYDWTRTTSENYFSGESEEAPSFAGAYARARGKLDYTYHHNPVHSRQLLQDAIIERVLSSHRDECNRDTAQERRRPWIVFTAGPMGVGKSHVLTTLYTQGVFPLGMFVKIDPDLVKSELPELTGYKSKDPENAATKVHMESTQITDVVFENGLMWGADLLVDGSLRDVDWHSELIDRIRTEFPNYRIAILHVHAKRETIFQRAERRGKATGRVVPREMLEDSIQQVPESVKALSPKVDTVANISNEDGQEPQLDGSTHDWKSFRSLWPNEGRCETLLPNDVDEYRRLSKMQRTTDTGETINLAVLKATNKLYGNIYPNTCNRCLSQGLHELQCPCTCYSAAPSWAVKGCRVVGSKILPALFRLGAFDFTPRNYQTDGATSRSGTARQ